MLLDLTSSGKSKTVDLDSVWPVADIVADKLLVYENYQVSRVYALSSTVNYGRDFVTLLERLDTNVTASLYEHLVDGFSFGYLVLSSWEPLLTSRFTFRESTFARRFAAHVEAQEDRINQVAHGLPKLCARPVEGKEPLKCFFSYFFGKVVRQSVEDFVQQKRARFDHSGRIDFLDQGAERNEAEGSLWIISSLDAPYGPEFWKEIRNFSDDLSWTVSIERTTRELAEKVIKRKRNIYQALYDPGTELRVDESYRYSVNFLYPNADRNKLESVLSFLRSCGVNVQVQAVLGQEYLTHVLPPGRVIGDRLTHKAERLFPFEGEQQAPKRCGVLKTDPSPYVIGGRKRTTFISTQSPLISCTKDTLITDDHTFSHLYENPHFHDAQLASAPYEEIDRALCNLADTPFDLTLYLQRQKINPNVAPPGLLRDQLQYLSDTSRGFHTKFYTCLNYRGSNKGFKTMHSLSTEQAHKMAQTSIDEAREQLYAAREGLKIIAQEQLTGDRFLELFNPLLGSNVASLRYFLQDEYNDHYLSEYLSNSDMFVTPKYVFANGRYFGTVIVWDLPAELWSNFYKRLLSSYHKPMTVVCKLRTLGSHEQERLLKRKQRISYGATFQSLTGVPDVNAGFQAGEIENMMLDNAQNDVRVEEYQIIILQDAETPERLALDQHEVCSKLRLLGMSAFRTFFATGELFFSCLPPGRIHPSFARKTTSKVANHLVPIHITSANQDLSQAVSVFVDTTLTVDSFKVVNDEGPGKRPNDHYLVTGQSGQGKTLAVQYLFDCHMDRYAHLTQCTLIDLGMVEGGSYGRMVRERGGEYVPLGYDTPVGFDLFARLRKTPKDKKELVFAAKMIELMTTDDKARKDGQSGIRMTETDAFERLVEWTNNVSSPDDIRLEKFIEDHYLGELFTECRGRLSNFFFNKNNIDVNQKLVCFDFQQLNRDEFLVTLLAYFIMNSVGLAARDPRYRYKFLVVDEGKLLLRTPIMADWIEEYLLSGRKAGLMVWLISQKFKHFEGIPQAPSILDGCTVKLAMSQAYHEYMEQMELTEPLWTDLNVRSEPGYFSEMLKIDEDVMNVNRLIIPPQYLSRRHTDWGRMFDEKKQQARKTEEEEVLL